MKIFSDAFTVTTKQHSQMLDITGNVRSIIGQSGISNGDVTVYCPHTTAAITINENADPSVPHDILLTLENIIPRHLRGYRHMEGNSDAHCKSSLFGCSERVLIKAAQMVLGTWQGIFFCEFDGPRSRKVLVQIHGE